MVTPNPIGHEQISLNLYSSREGICSALVPCNVFITFILSLCAFQPGCTRSAFPTALAQELGVSQCAC